MTVNGANIMAELYEEYRKKKDGNWEKVNPERLGMSEREFEEAANELKSEGYLPNFTMTKRVKQHRPIYFIGKPSDKAMLSFRELEEEE